MKTNYPNIKPMIWSRDFTLIFTSNLLLAFAFYILMPTLPFYLVENLHIPLNDIGLYLSVYVLAVLATRPFSGYFTDRFARRNLYIIMTCAFSLIFGMYLISASLIIFVIVRVLQGGAWSMVSTTGSTLAIDILPAQRRGEGIGYYGLSMTLAMALGPMVGLFLYDNFNFDSIFYTALFSSLIGFIISLFIKTNPKKSNDKSPLSLDRFFYTKAFPEFIVFMLIAVSYGFAVSYAAMFGQEIHVKNTGLFFIFMSIGTLLSRFTIGKLIDKGYEIKIIFFSLLALIFIVIGFAFCTNSIAFYSLGFFYGIAFGILTPSFQTLILNIAEHNRRGTANSTYFIGFDLGLGTGILIGSTLIAAVDYKGMYLFGGAINILAFTLFVFVVAKHYIRNKRKDI